MPTNEILDTARIAALGAERLAALLADLAEQIPAVWIAVEVAVATAADSKQAAALIIDGGRRESDDSCSSKPRPARVRSARRPSRSWIPGGQSASGRCRQLP